MDVVISGTDAAVAAIKVAQNSKFPTALVSPDEFLLALADEHRDPSKAYLWFYTTPWDDLSVASSTNTSPSDRLDTWARQANDVCAALSNKENCHSFEIGYSKLDALRVRVGLPKTLISLKSTNASPAAKSLDVIQALLSLYWPQVLRSVEKLRSYAVVDPSHRSAPLVGLEDSAQAALLLVQAIVDRSAVGRKDTLELRYHKLLARMHAEQELMEKQLIALSNELQHTTDDLQRERSRASLDSSSTKAAASELATAKSALRDSEDKYRKLREDYAALSESLCDAEAALAQSNARKDELQRRLEHSKKATNADTQASRLAVIGVPPNVESPVAALEGRQVSSSSAAIRSADEIAKDLLATKKALSERTEALHHTQELLEEKVIALNDLTLLMVDATATLKQARVRLVSLYKPELSADAG